MSNENIGAYGEYDFVESLANAKLSIKLQETKLFKTHFAEGDKLPNLDGNIEFLTKKVRRGKNGDVFVYEPEGSIYVQIKTLSHDYSNTNEKMFKKFKYKYSMNTKVINLVNVGARLEPVIIFLIDEKNAKYFWIHVSDMYAMELEVKDQGNKVIYFSDENELIDVQDFYNKVKQIYKTRLEQVRDAESNRLMLMNMREGTRIKAQRLLHYLDDKLINELAFITEHYYPDIWKFGVYLSYNENTKRTVLAIYEINYGSVETVCLKNFRSINEVKSSFVISGTDTQDDFTVFGKQFVESLLHDYFKSNVINPKYMPNIILHELAFSLIDTIASCCELFSKQDYPGVYYKDSVSLSELINHFNTMKKFSEEKIYELCDYYESVDVIYFDPLRSLRKKDCEKYKIMFDDFDNEMDCFYQCACNIRLTSDTIPYTLYYNVLNELRTRNENVIQRVWKHKDLTGYFEEVKELESKGLKSIGVGHTLENIYSNAIKFFLEFPQVYRETINKLINPTYVSNYLIKEKSYFFIDKEDPYLGIKKITFRSDDYVNFVNECPVDNITLNEILTDDIENICRSVNALSCSSQFIPLRVRSSKFKALLYNELVEKIYSVISERNCLNNTRLNPLRHQL